MNENITPVRIGNIYGEDHGTGFAGNVWDQNGISPTITTMQGGNREPMIIDEPKIIAMRGRNPINPSCRTAGIHTEQRFEMNKNGITNCLTTVQKDNLVLEPNASKVKYRIRKLTPKETWRLMDFTDESYNKAKEVNSNTKLYMQAGNAIVVNVLVAIIGQLFEGKETIYKSK